MQNCINCGERAFFYEETNRARTFCNKECQINGKYRNDPKSGIWELWKMSENPSTNPFIRNLMMNILDDLNALASLDKYSDRSQAARHIEMLRDPEIDLEHFKYHLSRIAKYFGVRLP